MVSFREAFWEKEYIFNLICRALGRSNMLKIKNFLRTNSHLFNLKEKISKKSNQRFFTFNPRHVIKKNK